MPLDLAKLQCVKPNAQGWSAACPVCRQNGMDGTGNHLGILRSGAFNCVLHPGDVEHNSLIWAAVGDGTTGGQSFESETDQQIIVEKSWDLSILDRLVKDHSYWNGRGISNDTVEPFRGGMALDGQMKGRYIFPIFDSQEEDKIIGFDGRHTRHPLPTMPNGTPVAPWKIVGPKNCFVWGGLDEIAECNRAILVESIGDSLMLREHDVPETLCLFGVTMSQAVLGHLIAANPEQIIVSTNRDQKAHHAGQKAADKITSILRRFFNEDRISIVFPPLDVKDWGEATREQIQEAFTSASQQADKGQTEESEHLQEGS